MCPTIEKCVDCIESVMLESCPSSSPAQGREYALAVAADATGSTPPNCGRSTLRVIATKLPFAT